MGWHGQPCSAEVTLPPLGVVWLVPEAAPEVARVVEAAEVVEARPKGSKAKVAKAKVAAKPKPKGKGSAKK